MANWEKIYRDHQKGGEAWASLKDEIMPEFKHFLKLSTFKFKHVLDIGCGTGYYLAYLKKIGFKVDGIDSILTAVKITKKLLGKNTNCITKANMFNFDIIPDRYDLIISIATIQHGFKKDIQNLINKIHSSLVKNGKLFITFPDLKSLKKWNTFKNNKKLSAGVYAPLSGPEQGLPHSFFTKTELQKIFIKFRHVQLRLDKRGRWIVQAIK